MSASHGLPGHCPLRLYALVVLFMLATSVNSALQIEVTTGEVMEGDSDSVRAGQARAHHDLLDDDGRAAAGGRRVEREGGAQGIRQARRGRGQAGSAPAGLRAVCGRLRTCVSWCVMMHAVQSW